MAAPTTSAAGTFSTAVTATPLLVPWVASPAAGDIAVILVEGGNAAITMSMASPWVQLVTNVVQGTSTAATVMSIFAAVCAGTESGNASVTLGGTVNHAIGRMILVKGSGNTASDITVGATTKFAATAQTIAAITSPGTAGDTALILLCGVDSRDLLGTNTMYSGWTNANLAGITEVMDDGVATGSGGALGMAKGTIATATSTGQSSVTAATTDNAITVHLGFKPTSGTAFSKTQVGAAITFAVGTDTKALALGKTSALANITLAVGTNTKALALGSSSALANITFTAGTNTAAITHSFSKTGTVANVTFAAGTNTTALTLGKSSTVANITLAVGTATKALTLGKSSTVANVTFAAGTDTGTLALQLAQALANITFAVGTSTQALGLGKSGTIANVTFAAGTNSGNYVPAGSGTPYTASQTGQNISFSVGTNTAAYVGAPAGPTQTMGRPSPAYEVFQDKFGQLRTRWH